RPPSSAFPPRRQDIERFVRVLLESRATRPIDSVLTATPSASAELAARIAAQFQTRAGTRRFGDEPLLKDWWTGALNAPAIGGEPMLVPGRPADLDGDAEQPSNVARLHR